MGAAGEREREREERQGRRFPYYAASPLRAAVAAGSPSSLTPLSVASTWNQIYTRRQLVQRSEIHTCKIKAWGMDGCTSFPAGAPRGEPFFNERVETAPTDGK
jgi:hypothetical protein